MKFIAVLATDLNGTIGKNNTIPWHSQADMRYFKSVTDNHVCIVGRNTFRDCGELPNRVMLVLTKSVDTVTELSPNVFSVPDIESAKQKAMDILIQRPKMNQHEIMVIGGKAVYESTAHLVSVVHRSVIDTVVRDPDCFMDMSIFNHCQIIEQRFHPQGRVNLEDLNFLKHLVKTYGARVHHTSNKSIYDGEYVGRGSTWGNGFSHLDIEGVVKVETREQAVMCYYNSMSIKYMTNPEFLKRRLTPLKGKKFLCYCANGGTKVDTHNKFCHGHVLAHFMVLTGIENP